MWYILKKEEVLKKLNTDENFGLKEEQVKVLQQKYGKNKLDDSKKEINNQG